jgi:uncharacterized membrane protein
VNKMHALPIHGKTKLFYLWQRFREWNQGSLLFYPIVFLLGSIMLVRILRQVDIYLLANVNLSDWWMVRASIGVSISSLVASSVLAFLAIVFSISLVALQLANQQYSPRVISIFMQSSTTKIALSLFIATFVYSFVLMTEILRTSLEQISIVSLFTNFLLIFACLFVFIVFMKSIMMMIRVTYIIMIIADNTRQAIEENLPSEEAYVLCDAVPLEQPNQIISFSRPPRSLFSQRYDQGVFKAIERSKLSQIGLKYQCVVRVLPRFGDFINKCDPVVEVYGEKPVPPAQVLKAIYIGPERSVYQDPSYGIRMLVDIALQALSPAVNAPTTAHEVILRLTNLLAMISQRPESTGAYTEDDHQVHLIQPVFSWDDIVELAFSEIISYGKDDLQTKRSLVTAFEYLLEKVPDTHNLAILHQKERLLSNEV